MRPTRRWWGLVSRLHSPRGGGRDARRLFSFLLAQSFEGRRQQLWEGRHSRLDSHVFQSFQEVRAGGQLLEVPHDRLAADAVADVVGGFAGLADLPPQVRYPRTNRRGLRAGHRRSRHGEAFELELSLEPGHPMVAGFVSPAVDDEHPGHTVSSRTYRR